MGPKYLKVLAARRARRNRAELYLGMRVVGKLRSRGLLDMGGWNAELALDELRVEASLGGSAQLVDAFARGPRPDKVLAMATWWAERHPPRMWPAQGDTVVYAIGGAR